MRDSRILIIVVLVLYSCSAKHEQGTEIQFLSGTGYGDSIQWDFYCTDGRKSGEWTKIIVPSNWEQQGFGSYNYGYDPRDKRAQEKGLYKTTFSVPADWEGKKVTIVFEGSMTDTEVKINGEIVGPVHRGAFYRFKEAVSLGPMSQQNYYKHYRYFNKEMTLYFNFSE